MANALKSGLFSLYGFLGCINLLRAIVTFVLPEKQSGYS